MILSFNTSIQMGLKNLNNPFIRATYKLLHLEGLTGLFYHFGATVLIVKFFKFVGRTRFCQKAVVNQEKPTKKSLACILR
jgi:hypothetical protein